MKKHTVNSRLLQLLVSTYNQSIQTYFYFPDVVICGHARWERDAFDELVANEFIAPYKTDSFGQWYRLSKTGEAFLFHASFRRRQKVTVISIPPLQCSFPFVDCS